MLEQLDCRVKLQGLCWYCDRHTWHGQHCSCIGCHRRLVFRDLRQQTQKLSFAWKPQRFLPYKIVSYRHNVVLRAHPAVREYPPPSVWFFKTVFVEWKQLVEKHLGPKAIGKKSTLQIVSWATMIAGIGHPSPPTSLSSLPLRHSQWKAETVVNDPSHFLTPNPHPHSHDSRFGVDHVTSKFQSTHTHTRTSSVQPRIVQYLFVAPGMAGIPDPVKTPLYRGRLLGFYPANKSMLAFSAQGKHKFANSAPEVCGNLAVMAGSQCLGSTQQARLKGRLWGCMGARLSSRKSKSS